MRSDVAATSRALPLVVRLHMLARLFAVQASWNYELMLGTGVAFALEPALRLLPGGRGGEQYRQAVARQGGYFNAHPYLVSIAAGALARAELDAEPHERIVRFRTALCGPLGSLGDRLVWAGWLPFCSLGALAAYGLGLGGVAAALLFLITYNAGHLFVRAWGLHVGWHHGLAVSVALRGRVLHYGPAWLARSGALMSGVAVPVAVGRAAEQGGGPVVALLAAAALTAALVVAFQRQLQGWRLAVVALGIYTLLALFA